MVAAAVRPTCRAAVPGSERCGCGAGGRGERGAREFAIKGSNRTTGRSDGQKGGLLRVRSSPDLGRPESGLSKKRDRNLNRRVHIPHPVPYPRAWASRPHEDLARAGLAPQKMQGSAQGKVPKSDGLLQALGRSSGRGALPPLPADGLSHTRVGGVAKVQHGAQRSKITLDPKVRARLEKMEREGKFAEFANEQMPTVNGGGRAGGHTHTSLDQAELESEEVAQSGEDDQAACEPPHSADSADGRSPQADVHPERGKEGTSDGNAAAPAPAPDFASQRERLRMQTMQGGLPPEAMQLGLPEMQPGVSGRAMQASGPQTPHLSHASVAMAPGDLVYPTMPHVYPVYMTQLGQVQLAGNHVFGMMPHPGSVQQPVGGPSVVAATSAVKPLPVMHVDQHAGLAESFYPQANVFPAVYYDQGQPGLSNGPLPSQLGFGTENVHLGMPGQGQASAQLGPLAVGPMASVQQSPASWAYVYPSTTQVASQRSSTDRFSDSSSSGDDVLSGDIETLTQHLEMARNLVGRKQAERERPPVANKTTATSYPRPARAEGPPAGTQGHNRKRQNQHVEEGPRTAYPPRTPPHRSDQHGGRDRPRDQTGAPAAQRSFQQSFQGGNFGHMMAYQQPFAPPPPPPQAGVSEPPAGVPVQGAEDVLFQVPANVAGHPAGGYIVRSPAGTAMVGNGPVVSPPYTALPTGPSLAGVASVEDAGGTGSREGHSTRAANWHFEDIASHTKPVALSTDDGKFVEIDPSVIRAVEAALAGMMSLGEVAQGQNMGGESRGPREENKDPPTDCSPRDRHGEPSTAAGRRMDAGAKRGRRPEAGMEGGLQRPHTAEATAALMQQNPAMFSAVNPAVNSALAFLAGAGARASHGAMAPEAGQRMGAPLHPDSFLVSRGMASYGTGSFIPALPQDDNRAATSGGEAHVAAGRGAESDPRAAPDALGELEGSNDGSWTTSSSVSLNTGSDRGDMDHKPHHRKNGRGGGPRPWQDHAEYGRRGPRAHHPAQQPYGWHDGQWQQGMERGGGMREVGEFYEYGHPTGGFFYSDARAQGYCAFGPGYPCPEREYDSMWYEYNGRPKGYRPGGGGHVYGWRGGARRGEREDLDRDGRWAMHGWPNRGDRHQMDGCSTPDNSNGHGAGRARGGSFQRRGNERWGGIREPADGPNFRQSRYAKQGTGYYEGTHTYWPRRVGRGGRRSDGADDGMGRRYPRGAPEQGQEEPQQAVLGAPGRPLPVDQPAERHMPGTPQRGSDPSGRKTPLGGFVMNGNGSPGADQERARSFTLNSEDFPALETATPQAGTSPPQLKSPRQAAMPGGGINPSIR
ncbi:unnamed protein product [Ostreobium quekettii]|uniref:Uncharacterized protein n=1 Tax=Ostreobium quekettii TaxID=121088 RepID=A0A8S1JCN6_9CHLO|nr:unnamed protein product [Ostreobium quekettii]